MDAPKVGQVWISRDRRDNGKLVRVIGLDESFVWLRSGRDGQGRLSRVRRPLTRLYKPDLRDLRVG